MQVGLKPKKFFNDIVLVSRQEALKEKERLKRHLGIKIVKNQSPRLDSVSAQGRSSSLAEVLDQVLVEDREEKTIVPIRIKPKKLFQRSLILLAELGLIALMIYNGLSLYFDKEWLSEKLNNLVIISKIHIANAEESLLSLDRANLTAELDQAGVSLFKMKEELLNQGQYSYILPMHPLLNNELASGQNMLELGLGLKETNTDLNSLIDNLSNNQNSADLLARAKDINKTTSRIEERVTRMEAILKGDSRVRSSLGTETSAKVEEIITKSKDELVKINQGLALFPLILGSNGSSKYLVLFLNNAEMRPGGGFPGNYGLISFANNNLTDLKVNDIYYLEWLKKKEVDKIVLEAKNGADPVALAGVPADLRLPQPMSDLSLDGYWHLFSSNWSLDFRENAKRAIYLYNNFYQQGPVEGVLAFTPDMIENILGIVGPIKMDNYGVEINKDNFREIMEYKVEVDNPYKQEGRRDINPKQILADFEPELMVKIKDADSKQKLEILSSTMEGMKQKEIVLYHQDPKIESFISQLGAGGEIRDDQGDFLGVAGTNLNAVKNGRMIEVEARLKSQVSSLGFAADELSLTITNTESNPRFLHGREEAYYEIMVPLGSRLREARMDGQDFIGEMDYFAEGGKNIFGFRIGLDPGEAKNVVIKYQAPLTGYTDEGYRLNLFKQVGAKAIDFKAEINFEDSTKYGLDLKEVKEAIDSDKVIKF